MKKIIYYLFGLLLFIPNVLFADMGSPVLNEYKVTITNPNGALAYVDKDDKYVKTDVIIPYGTNITVDDYELAEEGYAIVTLGEEDDEIVYYVSLKDTELIDKNYKVNEKELANKEKAIVLKDSVIRKGPANAYESTGVAIKAGTEIDVRFFRVLDDDEEAQKSNKIEPDYQNIFVYVEYNGTKGFICTYGATLAFSRIDYEILNYGDSEIKDPVTDKVIGIVKANTIFKNNIYLVDEWSSSYYVEYNGIKGLVLDSPYIWKNDSVKFKTTSKLNIYEKLEDDMQTYKNKLKVVGTIEKDTTFNSEYYDIYDGCRIYYKNGDLAGWIYTDMEEESDNCVGIWYEDSEEDSGNMIDETSEETNSPIEIIDVASPIQEKIGNMETVYICIGIAVIVCLTAVVTLILINKKKKSKEK